MMRAGQCTHSAGKNATRSTPSSHPASDGYAARPHSGQETTPACKIESSQVLPIMPASFPAAWPAGKTRRACYRNGRTRFGDLGRELNITGRLDYGPARPRHQPPPAWRTGEPSRSPSRAFWSSDSGGASSTSCRICSSQVIPSGGGPSMSLSLRSRLATLKSCLSSSARSGWCLLLAASLACCRLNSAVVPTRDTVPDTGMLIKQHSALWHCAKNRNRELHSGRDKPRLTWGLSWAQRSGVYCDRTVTNVARHRGRVPSCDIQPGRVLSNLPKTVPAVSGA